MEFREINDGEWEFIKLLLSSRARSRIDGLLNSILYVPSYRLMDMPINYGYYLTALGGLRGDGAECLEANT